MSTSPSVPDSQNVAPLDDVLSSPTPSPLSAEAVDPVTRLLQAAEGLALLRVRMLPVTRSGAAGPVVSDTEICDECQRQRVLSGMAHAGSCLVGQVLEACAAVRAASARTVASAPSPAEETVSETPDCCGGIGPCKYCTPDTALPEPVSPEGSATTLLGRRKQEWLSHVERLFEMAAPGEDIPEAALLHGWQGTLTTEEFEWAQQQLAGVPERRVVCGRAIAVFGFPGKDVLTCDLAPGHGDGWHHDQAANRMWVAEATELHFHPSGMVETRLLGREPEFDYSAVSNAEVAR